MKITKEICNIYAIMHAGACAHTCTYKCSFFTYKMVTMQEVDYLRGTCMKRGSHQMRTKPTVSYKIYQFITYIKKKCDFVETEQGWIKLTRDCVK